MPGRILQLTTLALLLWGCVNQPLDLSIRYRKILGLEKGDRVLFQENHIGDVTGVTYTKDGDYRVSVSIGADFKNAATEHSAFHLVNDPVKDNGKAVEIILARQGGTPLENGTVVAGTAAGSDLMELLKKRLDRGMEDFRTGFNRFVEEMKALPESEQFKELEKEVDRLEEELQRSGEAAREKLKHEVLPQLRENVEKLREWLKSMDRQQDLKQLEKKLDDLTTV